MAIAATCNGGSDCIAPRGNSISITSARVLHGPTGPEVQLEAELYRGSGVDPARVRSISLRRTPIEAVNPMGDHLLGPLAARLGSESSVVPAVVTLDGPVARRQLLSDPGVQIGATYGYSVAYDDGEPSPPVVVRVHDPETWWPTEVVQRSIDALRPRCRVETIGRGAQQGLPIVALRAGSTAPDAKTLVLIGAIHAGESGPELILPALAAVLERAGPGSALASALEQVSVLAVPVVNVDERDRLLAGHPTYLRVNPQGIDLNRNFPEAWDEVSESYHHSSSDPESWTYRGPEPLAAAEARALHDALVPVRVAALFSYHWVYSISGAELEQPKALARAPDELRARQAALGAAWFRGFRKRPFAEDVLTPITNQGRGGSLVTWITLARGAPAFEVEGVGDPRLRSLHYEPPERALLEEYQARHADALESVLLWLAEQP